MQSIQFATRARLTSWTYLWLSLSGSRDAWRDQKELESTTMKNFQAKLNEVGMEVGPFTPGLKLTLGSGNIDTEIDAAIKRFVSHATRKPPALLLVILPGEDATIYNSIKLACDVKFGVCNVCVIASKFAKERNDQYVSSLRSPRSCAGPRRRTNMDLPLASSRPHASITLSAILHRDEETSLPPLVSS